MTYEWEFETTGRPLLPQGRRCHRGPMIDVEERMSRPCLTIKGAEKVRQHLLMHIVDINQPAVQTRETVLRVLNSNLGPMFFKLKSQTKELQVLICEKKNSIILDDELSVYNDFYDEVLSGLGKQNVTKQHLDMILAASRSNNAILRVASKCAVVLMVAFVELDL